MPKYTSKNLLNYLPTLDSSSTHPLYTQPMSPNEQGVPTYLVHLRVRPQTSHLTAN